MNSELYHHLRAIVQIQNARRRNFNGKDDPSDVTLEVEHQQALEQHRIALDRIEENMRIERKAS